MVNRSVRNAHCCARARDSYGSQATLSQYRGDAREREREEERSRCHNGAWTRPDEREILSAAGVAHASRFYADRRMRVAPACRIWVMDADPREEDAAFSVGSPALPCPALSCLVLSPMRVRERTCRSRGFPCRCLPRLTLTLSLSLSLSPLNPGKMLRATQRQENGRREVIGRAKLRSSTPRVETSTGFRIVRTCPKRWRGGWRRRRRRGGARALRQQRD